MEKTKRSILSFKYAFAGIFAALKEEPNLRFHLFAGLLIIIVSIILKISKQDWLVIIFLIGFVITLELTNTAVEAMVDAFTDQAHPRAKFAKDIAAGAVLIAAITSAVLGILIFLPYIRQFTI